MKVIIKYFGELDNVRNIDESVKVAELLAQYAIVDIAPELLDRLRQVPEVIYVEEPGRVYPTGNKNGVRTADDIFEHTEKETEYSDIQEKLEMMQERVSENSLSGKGVIMGIVDSGECVKKRDMCSGENSRNIKYKAAFYIRLSRKEKKDNEFYSDSIYNQQKILGEYMEAYNKTENDKMLMAGTYIDDGYSGQNFERPGLKKMTADIKNGNINCIIVKDMSRIGRDYIEVGRFLKHYVKSRKVRLISVSDSYDSKYDSDILQTGMYLQLKNIINDEYSRDISVKVRTQLYANMKKGNFVGAFAPYGYKKSEIDKNKLLPDQDAAAVIREVFYLRSEGYSLKKIADYLNEKGVFTPIEKRENDNEKYRTPFQKENQSAEKAKKIWYPQTVKRILNNEIYAGILIQGKNRKINYKLNKIVKTGTDEWIACEKKELALIDMELYRKANKK